jgi:hypothetical protein
MVTEAPLGDGLQARPPSLSPVTTAILLTQVHPAVQTCGARDQNFQLPFSTVAKDRQLQSHVFGGPTI